MHFKFFEWLKVTQKLDKTKKLFISAPERARTVLSVFLDFKNFLEYLMVLTRFDRIFW